jgi:hypothetical protein
MKLTMKLTTNNVNNYYDTINKNNEWGDDIENSRIFKTMEIQWTLLLSQALAVINEH